MASAECKTLGETHSVRSGSSSRGWVNIGDNNEKDEWTIVWSGNRMRDLSDLRYADEGKNWC